MNKHIQINRFLLKIRLVVLAVILYVAFLNIGFAQDKDLQAYPIDMNDTLSFTKDQKGIFNNLAQIFKFRENRNRREQERIYKFMLKLIKDRDLSVDSNMNEIFKMLDTLNNADSIRIKKLDEKILTNNLAIDSLKTVVIDSFEVAFNKTLDSVFKKRMEKYFTEISKIEIENETTNGQLRDVHCSCKWLDGHIDKEDVSLDQCISTKVEVIGWHNEWNEFKYENYDYRYLSAINLYGYYELKANGQPKSIKNFNKLNSIGIYDLAAQKKTIPDFYLTIHSKSSSEISIFLKSPAAQNTLIKKLSKLFCEDKIDGVNIYFDNIKKKDAERFNNFIKKIHREIGIVESFKLLITIPSIYDEYSLEQASSYDFPELTPIVNQFILTTDRMVRYDSDWAQPKSPLNKSEIPEFGTIASNVNFYNKKIPTNKLIVSVSYLGQEWPVTSDFSGKVKRYYRGNKANDFEYSLIMRYYKNNKNLLKNLEEGYDSIQKSAYINVTDATNYFEPRYYKIWYENKNSLISKYNWILKNNLAGVSIRGLGYDDGYTDLWEAIGSTLVKNETRPHVKKEPRKECQFKLFEAIKVVRTQYDSAFKGKKVLKSDLLTINYNENNLHIEELIFPDDLKEALQLKILDESTIQVTRNKAVDSLDSIFNKYVDTRIFNGSIIWSWSDFFEVAGTDDTSSIWYKFQWYHYNDEDPSRERENVKFLDSLALYSDYKWASEAETFYKTEYGRLLLQSNLMDEDIKLEYGKYFEDSETCLCSYKRLIIFSKVGFYAAIFCAFMCLMFLWWTNWIERYNRTSKIRRFIVKLLALLSGLLAIILSFYGLFMTPYYDGFGASNHGDTSLLMYLFIILLGIILGLIIYSRYAKARFIRRDLP